MSLWHNANRYYGLCWNNVCYGCEDRLVSNWSKFSYDTTDVLGCDFVLMEILPKFLVSPVPLYCSSAFSSLRFTRSIPAYGRFCIYTAVPIRSNLHAGQQIFTYRFFTGSSVHFLPLSCIVGSATCILLTSLELQMFLHSRCIATCLSIGISVRWHGSDVSKYDVSPIWGLK